jgi:hypothetical protein
LNSLFLNQNNPLASLFPRRRESSIKTFRAADIAAMLSRFRGVILINWIPACAGMTEFFANGQSG